MKKTRIISIILLLFTLLSILSLTSCDIVNSVYLLLGKNYIFTKTEGGYIVEPVPISTSLKGLAKKVLTKVSVDIPSEYNGKPVVGIRGFGIYPALVNVTIPDTITYVEANAFGPLVQYNEYGNALYLGNNENPYIALIKVKNTDITSCEIHPDTKCIANKEVFANCNALTSISFKGNIPSYPYYTIPYLSTIILDDGVTEIPKGAFSGCTSITSITIPDSVTSIGENAFSDCASLTSVTMGNSVTRIRADAFLGCTNLTNITFKGNIPFYSYSSIPRLFTIIFDDGVTDIPNYAFSGCKTLMSITIPDSVTNIGEAAFRDCDWLTNVTIGDSVTSIGDYAFCNCASLKSVKIGRSVMSIGAKAFYGCTSLTSVTIPLSVTSIGENAFRGCTSLTSAVFAKYWDWYITPPKYAALLIPRTNLEDPLDAADYLTGNKAFNACVLAGYTWKCGNP